MFLFVIQGKLLSLGNNVSYWEPYEVNAMNSRSVWIAIHKLIPIMWDDAIVLSSQGRMLIVMLRSVCNNTWYTPAFVLTFSRSSMNAMTWLPQTVAIISSTDETVRLFLSEYSFAIRWFHCFFVLGVLLWIDATKSTLKRLFKGVFLS